MERWGERARSGEEEQSCDVILSLLLWSSYLEWNFVSQICCSVKHWLANSPKRIIEWNFAYSASAVQYELESWNDFMTCWMFGKWREWWWWGMECLDDEEYGINVILTNNFLNLFSSSWLPNWEKVGHQEKKDFIGIFYSCRFSGEVN